MAADPAHQVIEAGVPCGGFPRGIEEQAAEDDLAAGVLFAGQGGGARFQCLQPGLGLFDLAAGVFDSLWRRSGHAQSFRRSEEDTYELQSLMRNSYAGISSKKTKWTIQRRTGTLNAVGTD